MDEKEKKNVFDSESKIVKCVNGYIVRPSNIQDYPEDIRKWLIFKTKDDLIDYLKDNLE